MLKSTRILATVVALTATASVLAQETVTFELRSASDGAVVCPGAEVTWEIWVEITTTNNDGLALACVDLVQNAANPAKLDIPFADEVPAAMANFSRPAGISNPGEGGNTSGYVGVQRGATGEKNLVQLGGGQNTFGAPGSGMGTNPNVAGDVAKGVEVLLAAGSFIAPATQGDYSFALDNAIANVISQIATPPDFSPVEGATVSMIDDTLAFYVPMAGDLDGDGHVNLSDLAALLANYGGEGGYDCTNGDLNGDGNVALGDLATLLANYGS